MPLSAYFAETDGGDTTFTVDPPRIKFGVGSLKEIGDDARMHGMTRVGLFCDPNVASLEPLETVKTSLGNAGIDSVIFTDIEIEPTDQSFKAAADFAAQGTFDGFVSIGGGSTIDTAKAANLYSSHPADFLAYVNAPIGEARPVPGPLKPHIACPTTFGTASECTGIAIFDLLEMEAKTGIAHRALRPSLGVLDPACLTSLPPAVVAANGFDVFSHAIESLTARPFTQREAPKNAGDRPLYQGANPYSDIACTEAIRLIGENLVGGVSAPEDVARCEPLMFAGMLAGIGFGNAGCHVPHAMSYAVAGLVRDYRPDGWGSNQPMVPHGISVIVNAPAVFRLTGPACPERHLKAAEAMGADVVDAPLDQAGDILADRVIDMMKQTDMPNGLRGVGYSEEDLPRLVAKAHPQQRLLVNSPAPIGEDTLDHLFRDAMSYW